MNRRAFIKGLAATIGMVSIGGICFTKHKPAFNPRGEYGNMVHTCQPTKKEHVHKILKNDMEKVVPSQYQHLVEYIGPKSFDFNTVKAWAWHYKGMN